MLSFHEIKYTGAGKYVEGACLSTDTKPTSGILNGSVLIEMDTSKVYFYDESGSQWLEFGGESA